MINRSNPLSYIQRHFFSILFLSIYKAIGISPERRLYYGLINHCLRCIVTGADNLLDNEDKELLPLNFPGEATRFKSVMHNLVFDRFLVRVGQMMRSSDQLTEKEVNSLQVDLSKPLSPSARKRPAKK